MVLNRHKTTQPSNLAWKIDRKSVPLGFSISLGWLVLELLNFTSKIWETDCAIKFGLEN